MLSTADLECLHFHTMGSNNANLAMALRVLLFELELTLRPTPLQWFEDGDYQVKVITPQGTVKLTIHLGEYYTSYYDDEEPFEGKVIATVGGHAISEDSFLKMVGAI